MNKEAIDKALAALKRMKSYGNTFAYRGSEQNPYEQVCEAIAAIEALAEQPAQQEPVAWMYPEGLEALKNGKPWTAYGTKQEANNIALYLHPTPEREPYAWVTFTPYGDEDDVWYENPEGKLLEGWTYKPLYDATPPAQRTWVGLTDEERRGLREWQKIQEELGPVWAPMMLYLYEAIEAKLRSKNEDRN